MNFLSLLMIAAVNFPNITGLQNSSNDYIRWVNVLPVHKLNKCHLMQSYDDLL